MFKDYMSDFVRKEINRSNGGFINVLYVIQLEGRDIKTRRWDR